jgi:predicted MarR family transcription regulator
MINRHKHVLYTIINICQGINVYTYFFSSSNKMILNMLLMLSTRNNQEVTITSTRGGARVHGNVVHNRNYLILANMSTTERKLRDWKICPETIICVK